jgi:hypothetical protein
MSSAQFQKEEAFNQEVTLNGYCAFLDFWVAWLLLQPGFLSTEHP